jgi:N-acetylglutamate synthase-like GNAT family acetyltransferase
MSAADNLVIRDMTDADVEEVARLARALAGWFTANDMKRIAIDAKFEKGLLAERDGRLAGFLLYYVFEAKCRIAWMGVRRENHHQGIGRRLIERLEEILRQAGIEELYVGTLGDSVDYKPYVATRAFYRALGFQDFRRTLQDNWECPELLELLKRIEPRP